MVNEIAQLIEIILNVPDFVASLVHVPSQPLVEISQIADQFLLLIGRRPLSNLVFLFPGSELAYSGLELLYSLLTTRAFLGMP